MRDHPLNQRVLCLSCTKLNKNQMTGEMECSKVRALSEKGKLPKTQDDCTEYTSRRITGSGYD